MKITLNIHGTLAKFYRAFWNDTDLPDNLCSYFWKLVLAFIFLPICFPMMIINALTSPYYYTDKDDWGRSGYKGGWDRSSSLYGALINALIFLIGVGISQGVFGELSKYMSIWKFYANGVLFSVALILSVALIILLCKAIGSIIPKKEEKVLTEEEELADRKKRYDEYLKKEARKQKSLWYLTKKMFIAWKDKNCPLIEWNK